MGGIGYRAGMEETRNVFIILVGNILGRNNLGKGLQEGNNKITLDKYVILPRS
jgi:hypothetical protein